MFKSVMRVMTAPFHEVRFHDSFAADVLTSLPRVMTDFSMSSCFFLSGEFLRMRAPDHPNTDGITQCSERFVLNKVIIPVLSILPLWFRFLQSLRRYYDHQMSEHELGLSDLNDMDSSEGPGQAGAALTSRISVNESDGHGSSDFRAPLLEDGSELGEGPKGVVARAEKLKGAVERRACAERLLSGGRHPHLTNALNYALSIAVGLFPICHPFLKQVDGDFKTTADRAFQISWLFFFVISTLYSWFWDCTMDWGLWRNRRFCSSDGTPKPWLREQTMYHSSVYYFAIVTDLGLRFLWTLSLIPKNDSSPFQSNLQTYLSPGLAALEIMRRTMWACLRLENEHINNCGKYRKVGFVPTHFESDPRPKLTRGRDQQESEAKDYASRGGKNQKSAKSVLFEIVMFALCLLCIAAIAVFTRKN